MSWYFYSHETARDSEMMRGLGRGVKEFKSGINEMDTKEEKDSTTENPAENQNKDTNE